MPRKQKFEKLGWFYILALSAIALTIIISQIVIQNFISKQQDDSHIINVAGRQRMLSQQISKIALQIQTATSEEQLETKKEELKKSLELWVGSHNGLQNGNEELGYSIENSTAIKSMFQEIEAQHQQIAGNAEQIIEKLESGDSIKTNIFQPNINSILENEPSYLIGMNDIVFQYDKEAREKVLGLKNTEVIILVISLSIILLELLFIFRPIARNVRSTIKALVDSEQQSLKMSEELSRLYEELVRSYQELESTNIKPLEPKVYATIDKSGKFKNFYEVFRALIECQPGDEPENFQELLLENHYSEEFAHGLIERVNEGNNWSGELKLTNESGDFCWLEMFIVPLINAEDSQAKEHKIIARDITDLKEAKLRSSEINRAKIEERVKEQQYRSVLILEGQEEERKRLGRDIHDGIGQMLSALKLSLESITPSSSVHTKKRLEDTKDLMKSIIKETRRVSFNLTPTNLSDFGIIPAIRRFCQGVDALSAADIVFENKTRFINRLDSHIENNVYRIVQEAVNNAIKYAKASTIKVTFEHEHKELLITIEDDGRGFEYNEKANTPNLKNSGLGLFNMRERSAFINAKFELNSSRGQGTVIRVKIPIS